MFELLQTVHELVLSRRFGAQSQDALCRTTRVQQLGTFTLLHLLDHSADSDSISLVSNNQIFLEGTIVAALTSWTFLLALLDLLPPGELAEGLRSFLKFGDKELDVVQDVVQDLLPK